MSSVDSPPLPPSASDAPPLPPTDAEQTLLQQARDINDKLEQAYKHKQRNAHQKRQLRDELKVTQDSAQQAILRKVDELEQKQANALSNYLNALNEIEKTHEQLRDELNAQSSGIERVRSERRTSSTRK